MVFSIVNFFMKLQVISSFERSNLNLISICKIEKYDEYENNISIAKKTLSKLSNCSMIINLKIWNLFIKRYSKKNQTAVLIDRFSLIKKIGRRNGKVAKTWKAWREGTRSKARSSVLDVAGRRR